MVVPVDTAFVDSTTVIQKSCTTERLHLSDCKCLLELDRGLRETEI